MSSNSRDLGYSGPKKEYESPIGANPPITTFKSARSISEIGDLNILRGILPRIEQKSNQAISMSEEELSELFLNLNLNDERKRIASNVWSNFSDESNNFVSFNQIKEIENRSDRSSRFIVSEYKKDLRKPNGSSAVEVREIASIILSETQKMSQIVNTKVIEQNSSANEKFIELFLEWAYSTENHIERLNSFFELPRKQRNKIIPQDELNLISENDAIKYQTLFTVNVNALNQEIDDKLNEVKRNFLNYSDIFYQKIVYPLLNLDVNIPEDLELMMNRTELAAFSGDTKNAINRNIMVSLYDAADRNEKFDTALSYIEERISARENYLSYIRQLEQKGGKAKTNLVEGVQEVNLVLRDSGGSSLVNDHNSLLDRDADDAHPQYLSRYGGILTGDIIAGEGFSIDGIEPSTHSHDGDDGSSMIDGRHISGGTLYSSSVSNKYFDKPSDLQVVGFKSGVFSLDCNLMWFTKNKTDLYEVNFTFIPDQIFVDPGQEEETPQPSTPEGYIPPFEARSPLYIEWLMQADYELFFN